MSLQSLALLMSPATQKTITSGTDIVSCLISLIQEAERVYDDSKMKKSSVLGAFQSVCNSIHDQDVKKFLTEHADLVDAMIEMCVSASKGELMLNVRKKCGCF